ncbi:peptidoglycan-binding domain-containing protein [Hamadaea tsunoensis]|uniref:peptidoglycan-binding domain-containing protein n=1 Tax=Hamadaea tsunoensis TaxID=53368 RepID=UPI00041D8BFD|nr:peptidoglycan-binding domain-containing protein [Hamadaea tsunoensis]
MRRGVIVLGSAVLTAGAVTAAALGLGGRGNPNTGPSAAAPATEAVTRTTLTQSQDVNGVLGYGAQTTISSSGAGTLTWLPKPGSALTRGSVVYRVDDLPVVLFFGSLPLYRPLRSGDTGEDVRELERNLAALGYHGFTVDATFNAATATAVRRFQKDHGYAQSGVLDPATIVLTAGRVRVISTAARPGDHTGGPVLAYAGTTRVVTVALEVALQGLVHTGLRAVVTLPDGSTVDGTVADVGRVATQGDVQHPPTIDVTITVADQSKFGDLDQAPVVVSIVSAHADNVLTIPVVALVALAEGGYGVQVADNGGTRFTAVTLGMFGQGRVEVTGPGLAEGTLVVVPS